MISSGLLINPVTFIQQVQTGHLSHSDHSIVQAAWRGTDRQDTEGMSYGSTWLHLPYRYTLYRGLNPR